MTEKVLGFLARNGIDYGGYTLEIHKKKLVSVRLASESVGLKALKEWCEKNVEAKFTDEEGNCWEDVVYIEDLIEWAEKEAKKNE